LESIVKIPVKSERQAMDWSLVLLSQGIESRIDAEPEGTGWRLEVLIEDEQRAREAIRKYRLENRHWIWPRKVVYQGLLFDWSALGWVVLISVFFWASSQAPVLKAAGVMDTEAVGSGQWWRLCTAIWLHADPGHLASNASIGIVLLGLTLGLYGTGTGMLAACLAGIGGNAFAWLVVSTPHRSLGASGLVMGCIGLLATRVLLSKGDNRWRLLLSSMAAALMLFILLGLSPGTDIKAHAGGAGSGFILGLLLALVGPGPESTRWNTICGALFCALTCVCWVLAMASANQS